MPRRRKVCSVVWCANRMQTFSTTLSLYAFPTDPEVCEKWVEFCRKDDIKDQLGDALRRSGCYICSDHFELKCFNNPNNTRQGLLKGSVPSVLAGQPLQLAEYLKSNPAPNNSTKHRAIVPESPQKEESSNKVQPPTVEEVLARLKYIRPNNYNINKLPVLPVFKCHCAEVETNRANFLKERSRAEELAKEIDVTKDKISKVKFSCRTGRDVVSRLNGSVNKLKEKIRKLAEEYGAPPVDLSSDDNSDESNFSD